MNEERFSERFHQACFEKSNQADHESLRGFTTNPLCQSVTFAQAQMYQAAYQRAQMDSQKPAWLARQSWN